MKTWMIVGVLVLAGLSSMVLAQDELTEREQLLQQREAENEAWASLDGKARKVIADRAKYTFRINDDLIVDAYELFYWFDEAKRNIKATTSGTKDGYGRTIRSHTTYSYDHDDRFNAYFDTTGNVVRHWYRGVDVSEHDNWTDEAIADVYAEIEEQVKIEQERTRRRDSSDFRRLFIDHFNQFCPVVVVVDPLELRKAEYNQKYSGNTPVSEWMYGRIEPVTAGFVIFPQHCPSVTPLTDRSGDFGLMSFRRSSSKFVITEGRLVSREGAPEPERYLLMPTGEMTTDIGYSNRNEEEYQVYEVVDYKSYSMSPKALALAFVNGELDITYRELERAGRDYRCIEYEVERP